MSDYKQNSFLSPSEKQIINTLMPGGFEGTMRGIIAKLDEASYLFKLFNSNSTTKIVYSDAHTVTVSSTPWAYDVLGFAESSAALDAGVPIESAPFVSEPQAILVDPTATISVDIATSGAGGLDTGAEAISTWYYVYLVGSSTDPTDVDAVCSVSSLSDEITLPTGYDLATRVGMVFNNASSNFAPFEEKLCMGYREYWFVPYVQILVNGASTSWDEVDAVMTLPDADDINILGTHLRFSLDAAFQGVVGSATGIEFFNLDYALDSFHYNNEYLPNVSGSGEIWYKVVSGGGETMDMYMNGFVYSTFMTIG